MKRDIGQEILDGIKAIKAGAGKRVVVELPADVKEVRDKTGLSQGAFAGLLGVSVRHCKSGNRGDAGPKVPPGHYLPLPTATRPS